MESKKYIEKLKEKVIIDFELTNEEIEELNELNTINEIELYLKEIY